MKLLPLRHLGLLLGFLQIVSGTDPNRGDISMRTPKSSNDICKNALTCSECWQIAGCAWCADAEFGEGSLDPTLFAQRCNPRKAYLNKTSGLPASRCKDVQDFNSSLKVTEDKRLGKYPSGSIQIRPQKVELTLRQNEPQTVRLSYQRVDDYPLDLYFLMDLSKSMADDKDRLAKLGYELAETMRNLTSDFRLGFGSFVDKETYPFMSIYEESSAAAYLFQHHMSLSNNTQLFEAKVKEAATYPNLDSPEGGLEALIQAIVCREEIGWRTEARRLLVFSTDAEYHIAGDGKLAGITLPNDLKCHLDAKNRYTHSLIQDYPSISQVNIKAAENSINVIFAVTKGVLKSYERLAERIEGASSGELNDDSGNVVDLVKAQYEKISSEIEIRDTAPSNIKVVYRSSCLGNQNATNICKGLKVNQSVVFDVTIEATECRKDASLKPFTIYPVGFTDSLSVNVNLVGECPCDKERNSDPRLDKQHCSGQGKYRCGTCECKDGFYGRKCQCDAKTPDAVLPNVTVDCNRGTFRCGICECDVLEGDGRIWGSRCECDNFSCNLGKGLVCSGPEHGTCNCGKCECKDGWTGEACQCVSDEKGCVAPGKQSFLTSDRICSGRGECDCGQCICHEKNEGRLLGKYCEDRQACEETCGKHERCVICRLFNDTVDPECLHCVNEYNNIQTFETVKEEKDDERLCVVYVNDTCRHPFVYSCNEPSIIRLQIEPICDAGEAAVIGIVLGVIGAIVAIGLALLLLWKLLTHIHDKREYAKFEQERAKAKFDRGDNPLYKQPDTRFMNPAYAGRT